MTKQQDIMRWLHEVAPNSHFLVTHNQPYRFFEIFTDLPRQWGVIHKPHETKAYFEGANGHIAFATAFGTLTTPDVIDLLLEAALTADNAWS